MNAAAPVKIPKGMQVVKCRTVDGKIRTKLMDERYKEWQCHLLLFGLHKHGEDKLFHWKRFVEICWPEPVFVWDEWSDLFFGALCGAKETVERVAGVKIETEEKWWRNVIFTGPASSGKSFKSAMWILGNWICAQEHTTCVITSTSMEALRSRIWSSLPKCIGKSTVKFPLEIVSSEMEVRWNAMDDQGVIRGIAVKSGGNVAQAVDAIKGRHNRRVFVVIDEMTTVSEAIVVASRNLSSGTDEYQLLGLGNARDWSDPHGQRSEPIGGTSSITVDSMFWLTKFGCAVHFDAMKSPGMKDPQRFHFYPNKEWLADQAKEKGGEGDPEFWSTVRGFWPPSGLSTKVMDDAMLRQFEVELPATWKGNDWRMCGAFDPAFEGGDRRVLYPFKYGTFSSGIMGLEFLSPVIVSIDAGTDVRWIHYAIADAVIAHCTALKIKPRDFIMDTTGEGGGLFNILSGRWDGGHVIKPCEFGGAAEPDQMAPNSPVTYKEKYANKVAAMWFRFRRYVEGGHIRGLVDPETKKELCARDRLMKGARIGVIPKKDMKDIGYNSPDKADAATIAGQFLYDMGVVPAGNTGGAQQHSMEKWNEMVAAQSDDSEDYTADEEAYA